MSGNKPERRKNYGTGATGGNRRTAFPVAFPGGLRERLYSRIMANRIGHHFSFHPQELSYSLVA